jgi:IS30 family transposase
MAQLSMEEREVISRMIASGFSRQAIAARLGRARSTIGRELRRNGLADGSYSAVSAQRQTATRRRERPLVRKLQRPELHDQVVDRLIQKWSPEQISGRLKQLHADDPRMHVSPQTIYTWITQDDEAKHWKTFLRRSGKPPTSPRAGRIPRQVQIDGRPDEANRRERLGDFEGDTVVSRGQRSGIVTLVDRKSRYLLSAKLQARTAARTREKIVQLLQKLPADKRHTLTLDNGKEFAEHERIAKRLGIDVFFAHPYSSWERGTNEQTNGLLRQYFPKGTDFREISHHELAKAVKSLNDRPRKTLNYLTPSEVFYGTQPSIGCS